MGEVFQLQRALQPLQGLVPALFGGGAAENLFPGIDPGAFHQAQALSPLRDFEISPAAGLFPDQLFQFFAAVNLTGQQDRLRAVASLGHVVLPHQLRDRFAVLLQRLVQHLHVLPGKIPVHKVQHRKAAFGPADKAHGIGVVEGRRDHPLMILQALDGADAVPQLGSALKAQLFRGPFHLRAQLCDQFPALSLQDQNRLFAAAPVVFGTGVPQTPPGAFFHVVVEAGAFFADIPGEDSGTVRQKQRF